MTQWQPQAYNHVLQKDYGKASKIYEQLIIEESETITHYFYLGLLQLLQGQETEAQFTWMACITDQASAAQINIWTSELVDILFTEAQRQRSINEYETAWLICQHIHEIDRDNFDNSLTLIGLEIQLQTLDVENVVFIELIEQLKEANISVTKTQFNHDLLWELFASLVKYRPHPLLVEFTKAILPFVQEPIDFVYDLIRAAVD